MKKCYARVVSMMGFRMFKYKLELGGGGDMKRAMVMWAQPTSDFNGKILEMAFCPMLSPEKM